MEHVSSLMMNFNPSELRATDECFEGVNRAVFKFNMAFDDAILEPIKRIQ